MRFHGPIVRPPTDADSLFIEVMAGCTHNSCTFCNFYEGTPLRVASNEEIEQQLIEAKRQIARVGKIWASGGNPCALPTKRLIEIGDLFRKYYPEARVSTYARITDFQRKSVDDIRAIREHGIDNVLIGIESGDDEALAATKKGYTAADIVEQCRKLDEAEMAYRVIYLGGLLGAGRLVESARRSAEVINQIHPYLLYYTSLAVLPGTELYNQKLDGSFVEATERERLQEMRELLGSLQNPVAINSVSSTSGFPVTAEFPRDKQELLGALDERIASITENDERMLHARRSGRYTV